MVLTAKKYLTITEWLVNNNQLGNKTVEIKLDTLKKEVGIQPWTHTRSVGGGGGERVEMQDQICLLSYLYFILFSTPWCTLQSF